MRGFLRRCAIQIHVHCTTYYACGLFVRWNGDDSGDWHMPGVCPAACEVRARQLPCVNPSRHRSRRGGRTRRQHQVYVFETKRSRQTSWHESTFLTLKGPFIATQLNSTRRWVELRRWSVYSDADATQLNSTQLNSTRRRVEFSWVVSL